MSHRGVSAEQGRQGNGVTTSLSASPNVAPAALKPTRLRSCGANVLRTSRCSPIGFAKNIIIGPEPTPQDEVVFLLANEATKHLKGSKLT
jgi:hypothetical protein